ncbi:carbamoyltransferase HypF [Mycolicibacterium brisbanense]|uniref:Carbamoyltransferase n=1 Tax=Mycolicibacterium brisbanense TaxID=146020 RepID=A0A100W324_9MYCO|nr:carbamoyltransferase HypF [Mycolicibacterium brisbanense]MCV7156494.1 carbamoyltransferase HypF [Mycolicibacterium brisbanense]GAS90686.1 hydrogenase maturation protein HypF [Mycolicibacterium brisbanense]
MIPAPTPAAHDTLRRRRFTVTGVVQGVGFRPYVHRLATGMGLAGFVGNDSAAVFIEVQGTSAAVIEFGRRLSAEAPPLASVSNVSWTELALHLQSDNEFHIVASSTSGSAPTSIPPDIAVCDACVGELFDPSDRRYRHPFITCTECGPRFTIIRALPYDRPSTTMSHFPMCDRCAVEYHDPVDRRFHAQPIACPDCGPSIRLVGKGTLIYDSDLALTATQDALAAGRIVGIKGIGGYHLACAPDNGATVTRLRQRKARHGKAFAVMVRDLDVARRYAEFDAAEAAVLSCRARPVVLLRRRSDAPVAVEVAPGNPLIGLMLPYSPLHHLLLAAVPDSTTPPPDAIVLTSANRSDEPICYTEEDAAKRVPALADVVLDHNRPIHVPCDDSVVRVVGDGKLARELPIRRSRGYVPLPVDLGIESPRVLAVGGELKNTFCLTDGRRAYCSAHIGDMGSVATLKAFTHSVREICDMRGKPARIAADLHPRYVTRNWAEHNAGDRPVDLVQHHHAHVVSLLAEHGMLGEPIIGVAFDGTGYGCDDTVWGGEILRLGRDSHRFARVGHLAAVPLAGGDAAVRNPWRMALAHLWHARAAWTPGLAPVDAASAAELRLLRTQFATGRGCVPTTSVGRLFDAVASLLGVRQSITYEGQAAIELEVLAASVDSGQRQVPLHITVNAGGIMDPASMFTDLVDALHDGHDPGHLAAAFHRAVAVAVADTVSAVAGDTTTVGLTGGVFQNVLLARQCRHVLEDAGFTVLTHRIVPPNDGGLALGQAAVSALTALAESGQAGDMRGRTTQCV